MVRMNKETAEKKFSVLSNIMIHFLESCKKDYKTIGVHKDAAESIIRNLSELEKFAVILQKDFPKAGLNFSRKNKVDLFIVTIKNSVDELDKVLFDFKTSLWWDIMRPYIILSNLKNGCKNAQTALKKVWKMSILNCFYICFDFEDKPFVYTFNPYSSRAPYQWKMIDEISNGPNYMAIYNRPYNEAEICDGFDFDRTMYHDKTATKIFISSDYLLVEYSKLIETIGMAFNASVNATTDTCDLNNEEFLAKIKYMDIILCLQNYDQITNLEKLAATYPIYSNGLYIFSNNQRYLSPLEKKYSSFDISIIIGTLILSIVTYLVILYTSSYRSYSFATIEILRLWAGTSLNTKIRTQPQRIFFTPIFIYFMVMQSTLQGDLAEFLSKTELRQNANSLMDLQSDYYQKIMTVDKEPLDDPSHEILKSKVIKANETFCLKSVIKDTSNACVIDYKELIFELKDQISSTSYIQNFYLSKYPLNTFLRVFRTRRDWPLREKFDRFLMSLESFGINDKLISSTSIRIKSNLQTSRYISSFHQISLDSLFFIFICWTIGIVCSIISFIFESCVLSDKYVLKLRFVDKDKVVFKNEKIKINDKNNHQRILNDDISRKVRGNFRERVIIIKKSPVNNVNE